MPPIDSTDELVRALAAIHAPWKPRTSVISSKPAVLIDVCPGYKHLYFVHRGKWWFASVEGDSNRVVGQTSLGARAKDTEPRHLAVQISKMLYDFYVNLTVDDQSFPQGAFQAAQAAIPDIRANAVAVGLGIM